MAGTNSHRSTTADDSNHPIIQGWDESSCPIGRGLSKLLFDIFFAAVLTVMLQTFSKGAVILAELVHLKEPPILMKQERLRAAVVVGYGVCCTWMTRA